MIPDRKGGHDLDGALAGAGPCGEDRFGYTLEVVARPPGGTGFAVLPRRWVVERSFAWNGRYRRLSMDYEALTTTSEAMIWAAFGATMLRRLAKQGASWTPSNCCSSTCELHPELHWQDPRPTRIALHRINGWRGTESAMLQAKGGDHERTTRIDPT